MAGCGLAREIQERQFQALQNTCAAYGAGPGTPGYTDCMLRLHSEQVAQAIQAQRNIRPAYVQPLPNPYVPYSGTPIPLTGVQPDIVGAWQKAANLAATQAQAQALGSLRSSFTCQRIGTFTYCN